MQGKKSASWVLGATLPLLILACEVDQPISPRANVVDSGKGGSGGKATSGASGGVSTGGGVSSGASGSNGNAGSGGAGVSGAGGSAGAAGGDEVDASDDASADVFEAGPTMPEASTCAGFALQFDGAISYASITRNVQDDFTLEAWLKTDQVSLTGTNFWDGTGLIYADRPTNVDDFGTSMLNGHLTTGVGNPDSTLQGTTAINGGQWVHIATTRRMSTGELQVIVNGTLDGSTIVGAQTRSLTAPTEITIGGNTVDGRYLVGTMDEVRIWSVVRTPAEITSTMHTKLNGNETGLVGYWTFDEATGMTSTGTPGGVAQLYGTPQWVPSDAPVCP
jgi:Concanavalin A-like lectin/glucanases superfamily